MRVTFIALAGLALAAALGAGAAQAQSGSQDNRGVVVGQGGGAVRGSPPPDIYVQGPNQTAEQARASCRAAGGQGGTENGKVTCAVGPGGRPPAGGFERLMQTADKMRR